MLIKTKSAGLYDAYGREICHETGALKDDIHRAQSLEWYHNHKLVKVTKIFNRDYWARDAVLHNWDDQPRFWDKAVLHCANYARMMTTKFCEVGKMASRELILAALTNSNTYVAPNFDMDTAFNVADMITLKGSALADTDYLYWYNYVLFTIEQNLTLYLGTSGNTKSGAAGSGKKGGSFTQAAGTTVAFHGDATATNSGWKCSPTTAETASKNSVFTVNGTAASPCIWTTTAGVLATGSRYAYNCPYGQANIKYLNTNYTWVAPFQSVACDSSKTASAPIINNAIMSPAGAAISGFILGPSVSIDLACDFRFNTVDITGLNATVNMFNTSSGSGQKLISGGSIDVSGCKIIAPNSTNITYPFSPNGTGTYYFSGCKISYSDNRPTQVVPTGLTFEDLKDGTVKVTISNIASYRTKGTDGIEDYIQLFDASDNPRGGACSKTRYVAALDRKPANCFIVAGVPFSSMANWYAKATTNGSDYSEKSTVAGPVTPSFLPAVGKVMADAGGFGQAGGEFTPTVPVASVRDTTAGGTLDSNKILKSNSVPGNWNDDNLGVGSENNVRISKAYGLSQTGALTPGGNPPLIKTIDSGINQ